MSRWQPDARGRLQQAALELFGDRGFERTTVEDIANQAGLTKRTFFRYFADKREVLFGVGDQFQALFVNGLADAPAALGPIDSVAVSLTAVGQAFVVPREYARQRQVVIAASPELQERELVKLASIAVALAEGLRERGVEEPQASLAAETGMAVFRVAFERWVSAQDERDLAAYLREGLATLRTMTAGAA